jgi:putative phage-type endonuclease
MRSAAYETIISGDASRQDWLVARAGLITASDVPIILGIVPGKPKLWYEKVGMLEREESGDPEVPQMGHDMEPFCASQYVKKTGRRVRRCQQLLRSKRYPWLGATLDYWTWIPRVRKPVPLELKVTGNKELWPEGGKPAMKFQAQLQAQMIVTGTRRGALSVIIGSPYIHHRWADIKRDSELCDLILTETKAFADSVRAGVDPPVDGDTSTSVALRRLVVEVLAGTTVMLPRAAIEWDRSLQEAKAAISEWEHRKRFFENMLMTKIGDHETGQLPDDHGRYTLRRQTRAAHTVKETTFRKLHRVAPETAGVGS